MKIQFLQGASVLIFLSTAFMACDSFPRGESKSLSQVYAIAQERYSAVNNVAVAEDVKKSLTEIEKALQSLAVDKSPSQVAEQSKVVASNLDSLIAKAGYTSRPALRELMYQYLALSEASDKPVNTAAVRLLVSRTLTAIASELETIRFTV